jgi:S1-C subfamily serine protease
MRLYSRGQLIMVALSSVVLVFALALGFGLVKIPQEASAVGIAEAAGEEPAVFQLATNPKTPDELQPVNWEEGFSADELENIRIYESVNEGVVNISTETLRLNWFLEPVPSEGGTGSGSIIDTRGYVLTNYHVVQDAYKVFVNLHDGSQFQGEVIGKDPENDLAVVKFDPAGKNLRTIPFGISDNLRIGQKVLAIGNPFGYDRTLTTGVISGVGRPMKTSTNLIINDMIQTDASINPGNSGGPLLNSRGEMIGINTMIFSPSGGSIGIGFSVPVDTAKKVVPELIEHGMVIRGWLDVIPVQLDANIVRYARLNVTHGLLVSSVASGGLAEKAGLQGGDQRNPVRYGRDTIYLGGISSLVSTTPKLPPCRISSTPCRTPSPAMW